MKSSENADVKSFSVMMLYVSIRNLAQINEPLMRLTKTVSWLWNNEKEESLENFSIFS